MAENRKNRQAKLAPGPGVFVYQGGAFDTHATPTYLRIAKNTPRTDADGVPVLDAAGRQTYEQVGAVQRDPITQKPMLGGKPKVERIEMDPYRVSGIAFPKGVAVQVPGALALKLRGMNAFAEERYAKPMFAELSAAEVSALASKEAKQEAVASEGEGEGEASDSDSAEEPAKRKPGRPKKVKPEEQETVS